MIAHNYNPSTQEDCHEFKASHGWLVRSVKPELHSQDPISKQANKQKRKAPLCLYTSMLLFLKKKIKFIPLANKKVKCGYN